MKKHAQVIIGLGVALLSGMMSYNVLAQQAKSSSEKSFTEARRVLDAGVEALGGREALQYVEDFSI